MATSRLWREVSKEIAPLYPEVETEFMFVDNAAMRMIQWPTAFDVMVTENMFGDISDRRGLGDYRIDGATAIGFYRYTYFGI